MASINEPYGSELVFDLELEQFVAGAIKRPAMYIASGNYYEFLGYISGYNDAKSGGPLRGLHQWMVVKLDGWNNVHWAGIILKVAGLEERTPIVQQEDHAEAFQALGRVLGAFFEYRHKVGLTKIFHDYGQWLLSQDWYEGPLKEHAVAD